MSEGFEDLEDLEVGEGDVVASGKGFVLEKLIEPLEEPAGVFLKSGEALFVVLFLGQGDDFYELGH